MDQNSALQLMFPLADAVQFPLFLHRERKDAPYEIKGYGNMCLPLNASQDIPFKVTVVASGFGAKEAYVVLRIMGDLYAMLAFDKVMNELNFTLLDGAKMGHLDTMKNLTVKQAFDQYLPAIMGMWMREERNPQWSRLDATEALDQSTIPSTEKAHRPADRISAG